jgi:hypothetical protein
VFTRTYLAARTCGLRQFQTMFVMERTFSVNYADGDGERV